MSDDVLTLLTRDHRAVETLLGRFDSIAPADRASYFCEVTQNLVAHEVSEELVVYPALREHSEQGEAVTEARLGEQAEAEETLAQMEDLDPRSAEFTTEFKKLRQAVLAHAQAEESSVFSLLERLTTIEQRQEMGDRYEKAKTTAPTHPHPHAPDTPPGNIVMGPVAAIFDRARDALHRA
jgi:hemerythrin superfamily protein